MLSRVADSLYWMGRYLERAENITRLLLVTEDFSTETQGLAEDLAQTAWKDMLAIFPSAQLSREVLDVNARAAVDHVVAAADTRQRRVDEALGLLRLRTRHQYRGDDEHESDQKSWADVHA